MFSLKFLRQSNLHEDHAHSVIIALLRGGAALQVVASHLRALLYPSYASVSDPSLIFTAFAFLTGFSHQAVVIFFLLSGWLVGGSLLNKAGRAHAISDYAVDRITRLWIVLVPIHILTLLVGIKTGILDASTPSFAPDNAFSGAAFVGNLAGLQTMAVPEFGGNFPLWSLANETWYYILFPILMLVWTARSMPAKLCGLAALATIGACLDRNLLLFFSIWLMGAAGSRIEIATSAIVRWLFLGSFLAMAVYFRIWGKNVDLNLASLPQDCIYSVAFLLFLVSMQFKLPPHSAGWATAARYGRFFASFSFTLYVLHVPLIGIIFHYGGYSPATSVQANSIAHLAAYGVILCAVVFGAYLFHLPFEANTHRLRNHIKRMIGNSRKSAIAA